MEEERFMVLNKMVLHVNGVERMFMCDPEKDTLADVLRRMGLTGVKVGCGTGVCGACSVLLDGKLLRSCTKKIKDVPLYSHVTTIEGIGTPQHLHPLQVAFIHLNALQCGFCTPGFIVSAYALLSENPAPTRQEVRAWFHKHRNACRCTGYKQITDAVMAAAAVMRGECRIEDITYKTPENGRYYGSPVVRPAALGKACGLTDFGEDLAMKMPPGTLHAALYIPRVSYHAKIKSLDTSEAETMPGVVKVVTVKDVKGTNRFALHAVRGRSTTKVPLRTVFCEDKIVRFGDCLAAVVADTEENARAAVSKIKLEIEPLPAYRDVCDVCMPGAVEIHPGTPNLINVQPKLKGAALKDPAAVEGIMDRSAFSAEASFSTTAQPHLSIEGDTVQAYWDEEGNLTIQCKSQNIYGNIEAMGVAIGVPDEKLRIITNPAGGTFGWGIVPGSFAIAGVCVMCVDRPVALHLSYAEHMCFSGKRSASKSNVRLTCDESGRITASAVELALDHGAYRDSEQVVERTARFTFYPYYIPDQAVLVRIYNTNNAFGTAFRGFGSPQIYTCCEGIMDILAKKAGIDPFEFRWRNIARSGETNTSNYPYRSYPMEQIMEVMRPYYERAVEEAGAADTPEKRRGVGLAWGGYASSIGPTDQCTVALELNPDGSFTKYDTGQDVGQGGDAGSLIVTVKALEPLGVKPEDIHLVQSDSRFCPNHGPSSSSRSHFMNSNATKRAADKLMDAMRKPDGSWRSYKEMIAEGIPVKVEAQYVNTVIPGLKPNDSNTGEGDHIPAYNYMLFLAEVSVDTKTGKTEVLRYTRVDDVGVIGNIGVLNGQAYSGIVHGIGFALREDYLDDARHGSIAACGIPYALDVPDDIEIIHCENPRKENVFGSAGCAEGYQSSSHMAVINAIDDACGVRIYELPALPAKIKDGLKRLSGGEELVPPEKYYLGEDMFDTLDSLLANPM
jgi:aldehyde oxidoreductase